MPRIFGLNAVGVLVSALAFFMVGSIIYGFMFNPAWAELWGFNDAQLLVMEANMPTAFGMGFLLNLVTAIFLGIALKKMGTTDMMSAMRNAVILWAGFACTTLAYDFVYAMQPIMLLAIDAAHLLIGFTVVAVIQNMMDGIGEKATANVE